ncbi:3-dehydroquinate synthase II family protein [Desulfovibrio sp. OttesenSCG-928-G11]|nr:3-dehydroquinate synthase II family protein [Desulfovibrio sp. OttesenSCG-928-G11]
MVRLFFKALPFVKEEATLALEAGVDGLIVPDEMLQGASSLARCQVIGQSRVQVVRLLGKADEQRAVALLRERAKRDSEDASMVLLAEGWEIIPVENILAAAKGLAVEAAGPEEAALARGILERGVDTVVFSPKSLPHIKELVRACKYAPGPLLMQKAVITRISQAAMGHRVCVDTTSLLCRGQGMLVGNSSAFTFLINAESEHNAYVAARPFRVNAGGVHAYALMPGDRTAYLEELGAGDQVLIVDQDGACGVATVGRVKIERRPMLLIEAEIKPAAGQAGAAQKGGVFLQNAETISLLRPGGAPVSVVQLKEGDTVLCHVDAAGRHFGMRISEDIREE